ncbi:transient receptor potential cation channel subfamily V member 5-like [Mya arenaria]|uniref:transient receptor potential cation channel subfamily V member 5-like n=1 Tax=Mya arenaria TaxID=6604 RepID=UPI0022E8C930|nr:transient receptor potential cation channel subfamily V member 5-like [Mya arenaria]XP_052789317.1 transient receptor potential cation channel subfamily V member 5-like [Mya arenaria]XP_052789318.1 transient receptor potential cation channel subfamily V member 5-like [Mya arenaria]XP_052789319.1 transient receptor potential cation channel subfamily V member 5-like [Mya arenaria]XP_052789320.1 transient receptor potential cation channel subfamily V member 5-like [Mya arenaria]XP_052789321.1 
MAFNSKSYKDHYKKLLFLQSDRNEFFRECEKVVSVGDEIKISLLIEVLRKEGKVRLLASYKGHEGESILHVAAKYNRSSNIIQTLVKTCPELLTAARKESQNYYGQTALHVAIAKGNVEAVEFMLSEVYNQSQSLCTALLHQGATGMKFANTVMMGELPLSVAALTFNIEMLEILLKNGAEMERQNTKGDTVFHSLIRFAAIYPEHTDMIIQIMTFLHEKINENIESLNVLTIDYDQSDKCFIWFIPNNEDLNPLQLSASLSQSQIFEFILKLPKVYCFLNNHDGLFDRKSYDITEIDTIATENWATDQKMRQSRIKRHIAPTVAEGVSNHKFSNKNTVSTSPMQWLRREKRKSILETMFDIKSSAAFDFIKQPIVRHVIKTKWLKYRIYYYLWMLFHVLFMITLTIYAVFRAEEYVQITPEADDSTSTTTMMTMKDDSTRKNFLEGFLWLYFSVGLLYFLFELIHVVFRIKTYDLIQILNILHNGMYRIILTIFSVCLIIDVILTKAIHKYENHTLIISLITGWWFTVFFFRAHKKFSFFTVMIQKIIFGDMIRFSLIIVLMLIAFTAAIYMTFKGSATQNNDLLSFEHTMMLLFKLMLGLGDIEELYQARRPWIAVTLFIVFVILTYVLMLNALIAMMSQTCNMVSENRHVQWRVQQLSIILFFEGFLPRFMTKLVGDEKRVKRFDPMMKQINEEKRYFYDMSSLQTEYASAEDIYSVRKRIQYTDYQRTEYFQPSFIGTSPMTHCGRTLRNNNLPYSPSSQMLSPISENDNLNLPATSKERPTNYDSSPQTRRRKSKREKSPADLPAKTEDEPDTSPERNREIRQSKRRFKKKRVEPEGDYTSLEEHNKFYLKQEHVTMPQAQPPTNYIQPHFEEGLSPKPAGSPNFQRVERRRHYSESGLIDTHIGTPIGAPMQQKYPIRAVQPATSSANQNAGALDIGVIADSYM